jgi:hypothetical protein
MAIIGIGIDIWTPSINGGSRINLPPGQAILFSRGQATVSFVAASPGTLAAAGAAVVSFVGAAGGVANTILNATGAATVSFVGAGGSGGGTTGQPMGLLLALTYP